MLVDSGLSAFLHNGELCLIPSGPMPSSCSHDATVPKTNNFSCSGSRRKGNKGRSDKGLRIEETSLFYHVVGELLTNVKF